VKWFNSDRLRDGLIGVLVAAAVLAPLPLAAESETRGALSDVDATGNAEIKITAQRLVSHTSDKFAEFIGDVAVRQGETTITADRLKIFFSAESSGESASPTQSLERLEAIGNVEIKFDNRLAVAQKAVYITAQRLLILNGPDARVTSGENTITGETITFYRDDGRFVVEGGENGRVKAVILPQSSGLE
jgi:lipopolysaccharide export system protein LptA